MCLQLYSILLTLLHFGSASLSDVTNITTKEEFLQSPYNEKIVGGQEAEIEEHPYQCSFTVNQAFCGCFIVSDRYIITTGHCVMNADPTTMVLRVGSSFRNNGIEVPIAEVTLHPEYNHHYMDNDVAVLKSVDQIPLNNFNIKAIPLPAKDRPMRGGTLIVVSGWGSTKPGGSNSERLMHVQIRVIYDVLCTLFNGSLRNKFCASNFFLGGQGACQGDYGGAAIQDGMAVGILSFVRGCSQLLSPSVFTDTASPSINNFIRQSTGL